MKLSFGLGVMPWHPPDRFLRIAQMAEARGFTTLWVPDERFFYDCYAYMTLAAQAVILGGLSYHGEYIQALLGRMKNMLLTEDILRESSATRDLILKMERRAVERGREKGRAQGIDQGRLAEARRNIGLVASLRFPALGDLAELDSCQSAEQLEHLLERLVLAGSVDEAARALGRSSQGGRRIRPRR